MGNIFLSAIKSVLYGVGLKDSSNHLLSFEEKNNLSKIESFLREFEKETGLNAPEVAVIKLDVNVDNFIKQNFEEDIGDKFGYSFLSGRVVFGKNILNFENCLFQLFESIWEHNHYLLVSMTDFVVVLTIISVVLFTIYFAGTGSIIYLIADLACLFIGIISFSLITKIINYFSLKFATNSFSDKKILEIISSAINNKKENL